MKPHLGMVAALTRSVLCVTLLLHLQAPVAHAATPLQPTATPAALIKNIVVGNRQQTAASSSQAIVTRTGNGGNAPASAGLLLYRGDVIETFADTKVTVLFLDAPVAERDNQVIIDAHSRVGIASTVSWWGTVWAKVKGSFNSRTRYVRLGAKGTEYEFKVFKDEDRATVVVLEGEVIVTKETSVLPGRQTGARRDASGDGRDARAPFSVPASFARTASMQEQFGRALDIEAGRKATFNFDFHIMNNCREAHRFTFHTGSGSDWLQVKVAKDIVVGAGGRFTVAASVEINAVSLSPGQYRERIFSLCADCTRERRCTQAQLAWPINLTVKPASTRTPTQTPFSVHELEESTLTKGTDIAVATKEDRVLSVLSWTNNVILNAQPTYSAQNVLPHFATVAQRSQNFSRARQRAILERNRPGSNKILGDVYADWGEGAQAVRGYEKELSVDPARQGDADFKADLGEAYRLTGQHDEAQRTLNEGLSLDRNASRVLNARGNLYLDKARIEVDKRYSNEAGTFLKQAQDNYQAALTRAQRSSSAQSTPVIRTNLGETYLIGGDIRQRERNTAEAREQYQTSIQLLNAVPQSNSQYPFAITNLGRAFQGLGNAAQLDGNSAEARTAYAQAESRHRQAIALHPDMAEAYFYLGDLFEDQGKREAAMESYAQAIQARPEQPASYYALALLLQTENPRRAAALASTYLQLLPEVFRQGEKAKNAALIERGVKVTPHARPSGIDSSSSDATVVPDAVVPDVVRMSRTDAVKAIERARLVAGNIEQRGGSQASETVVEQRPPAGATVRRGTPVNLVVGGRPGTTTGTVKVPNVDNDRLETARREITARGLAVGQINYRASCESVGKVLVQSPKEGTRVGRGTAVDITVGSVGEDAVSVPNLVGRSREEVREAIREIGLMLGRVRDIENEKSPPGTVIKQEPGVGSQLAKGCRVQIDVAVPVPTVEVGNYTGMTEREALFLMAFTGLTMNSERRISDKPSGRIIAQNPPPGSRVRKGTYVRVIISSGSGQQSGDLMQVPNIIGRTFEEAQNIIKSVGLIPNGTVEHNEKFPDDGRVFFQSPKANQQVKTGTVVAFKARPLVVIH